MSVWAKRMEADWRETSRVEKALAANSLTPQDMYNIDHGTKVDVVGVGNMLATLADTEGEDAFNILQAQATHLVVGLKKLQNTQTTTMTPEGMYQMDSRGTRGNARRFSLETNLGHLVQLRGMVAIENLQSQAQAVYEGLDPTTNTTID